MEGLIEGRMVHYQFPLQGEGLERVSDQHLAAVVTEVVDKAAGIVNLAVFVPRSVEPVHAIFHAEYSDTPAYGKWHWIERA